MKRARFLRFSSLEGLRDRVGQNLTAYRSGDFGFLAVDPSHWFEHDARIDGDVALRLLPPEGQDLREPENCAILYRAMATLSPYEARDERLWAYLTHVDLLVYSRQRWPVPEDDDDAVVHIRKHFFARDKRQVERDNAASRLWWMAHLCARVPALDFDKALRALLFRSDVRANILERPTSSQSVESFGAILNRLSASLTGDKLLFERSVFRRLMREFNSVGSFKLLDCLSAKQIEAILDEIISERLGLAKL